jgi:hypothetical protein
MLTSISAVVVGASHLQFKLRLLSYILGQPCRVVDEWYTHVMRIDGDDADDTMIGATVKMSLRVPDLPEFPAIKAVDGVLVVFDVTSRAMWEQTKVSMQWEVGEKMSLTHIFIIASGKRDAFSGSIIDSCHCHCRFQVLYAKERAWGISGRRGDVGQEE